MQLADPDEKTQQLEELTGGVPNGIGDVEAASNVLKSINISDNGIQQEMTINKEMAQNILNSLSNLVDSDLMVARTEIESTSKIGDRYINVTNMNNVVKPNNYICQRSGDWCQFFLHKM